MKTAPSPIQPFIFSLYRLPRSMQKLYSIFSCLKNLEMVIKKANKCLLSRIPAASDRRDEQLDMVPRSAVVCSVKIRLNLQFRI